MTTVVVLHAVRALMRADSRAEAAAVLHTAVRRLGGEVVPEREAGIAALPWEISLGLGPACLAVPVQGQESARRLRAELPPLLEDAEISAARADRYLRQAARARTDALTGLAGRGEVDLRLEDAAAEDVVCLLDLDDFKTLNDTRGHAAGDAALKRFGELLRAGVRDFDLVGRYGGDEFLVIFTSVPAPVAVARMEDIVLQWSTKGPGGVSVGLSVVDLRGPRLALAAADRALYRAKAAGGACVKQAGRDDFVPPR